MKSVALVFAFVMLGAGCVSGGPALRSSQAGQAVAPIATPVSLDFLAGQWSLHDASGAMVGSSTIVVQEPGAMLYERRTVGQTAAQPLWFENAERTGGWVQLFLNPAGRIREFSTLSEAGQWPLVLGGDVILRDGAQAQFRLTISRASDDESRRVLEMSRDSSQTWTTVLDYTYRRALN